MRNKQRLFWMGGMLAGAVALGCQTVPQVVPGGPRMVVHYGAVKLEPDADMAIVLNRQDCNDGDYSLQQAAGPDPRVDRIKVVITGIGLVEPLEKELTRAQFTGCDATLNLTGLAPGQYQVRFTSYNAGGDPVAYANGSATVALGTTPQLNLVCDFNMGSLDVNIHCCASTPGPGPSSSAPPTPVPTPYVKPSDEANVGATGFAVSENGSVYVSGGTSLSPYNWRILKWNPDLSRQAPYVVPSFLPFSEGEVVNDVLITAGPQNGRFEMNLAEPTPQPSLTPNLAAFTGWGGKDHFTANTVNPENNHLIWGATATENGTVRKVAIQIFEQGGPTTRPMLWYQPSPWSYDVSFAAHSLSWANDLRQPIWSSEYGVCTYGSAPAPTSRDVPAMIMPGPVRGLLPVSGDSDEFFFTRWGYPAQNPTPTIYYYNAATHPSPVPVTTFDHGWPRQIERGADGEIYAMLTPGNTNYAASSASSSTSPQLFRIVRLEWNNDPVNPELKPAQLLVDYFPTRTPSFDTP